jgi:predicted MFS family arabinose efflux permease
MNDAPNDPDKSDPELARRKLVGRAMVVGLLLLVAVYAVFTYLGRR